MMSILKLYYVRIMLFDQDLIAVGLVPIPFSSTAYETVC